MKTLEVRGVTKSFFGIPAIRDMHFTLKAGEIHCLVGENGAGKSTVIKVLAGFHIQDAGEILIDGQTVRFSEPRDSQKQGIAVIHQELLLVPHLTVAENIVLGRWPTKSLRIVDSGDMLALAVKSLGLLNANIDPDRKVCELSTGEQQLVEIARALSHEIGVLILDEPTASLSETEAARLLDIVKGLRDQGLAILYVSHRLEEVFELADTITVIRDGNVVGTRSRDAVTSSDIVKMMVGREVELKERTTAAKSGNKVLEVKGLCRKGVIEDISFDLYEGEILGLAGLVGSGRTEVARAIFGLDGIDSGQIRINQKDIKITNPGVAMKYGINLVPEDRKTQGLVLVRSVKENITLAVLGRLSHFGWMNKAGVSELVNGYKDRLRIKTQSVEAPVLSLSGGNQQKVVLARGLATNPKILILDEPTRGVDVGAREEIQRLIEELVSEGLAILIISSDLLELLAMSDRVIVLRQGRQVAELSKDEATKEEVLQFATGSR